MGSCVKFTKTILADSLAFNILLTIKDIKTNLCNYQTIIKSFKYYFFEINWTCISKTRNSL